MRGTAQQILDRYLAMARDAQSSGDSVLAENLFQHAEHYQRLVAQFAPPPATPQPAPADTARGTDGALDTEAEAQPDREALETETGDSAGTRPRRRRRQRNAPVESAPAETGATPPAEDAPAKETAAEAV